MALLRNDVISSASLPSTTRQHIRHAIALGNLLPGDHIDERKLSADLGFSRTPIREALQALAAERLVETRPRVGFVVRRLSLRQLQQSYEVRSLLEGHAAERAAPRITEEELWDLGQDISRAEFVAGRATLETPDLPRLTLAHHSFHEQVVRACRNEFVEHAVDQSGLRPLVYRSLFWASPDQRASFHEAHRSILRALQARDGAHARRLVVDHLAETSAVLIRALADHPEYVAPPDRD